MTTITLENLINSIAEVFSDISVNEFDLTGEEDLFDETMQRVAARKIYLFSSFAEDEDEDEIIYNFKNDFSKTIEDEIRTNIDFSLLEKEIKTLIF